EPPLAGAHPTRGSPFPSPPRPPTPRARGSVMTTPPDPLDRIRRQLQDASTRVRLTPGSELDTVRAAHRRRNRGRALVGAAAVVAVGGGTVVAVQQLGKTSAGTFGVGSGDGGTPDHAVAPTSPVGATTTTVVGGLPQVDVRPAEPV